MEEGSSENKKSGTNSTKRLVRILVIVGIGIPVIVELLTLFNLINVQLFTDEQEQVPQFDTTREAKRYMEGDTLFADYAQPVVIRSMEIKVSARHWRYELSLMPADSSANMANNVVIDSLKLESGKVLTGGQASHIRPTTEEGPVHFLEWELPTGDIPRMMILSAIQPLGPDSTGTVQKEIRLGKIPIRYRQE